VKRPVHIVLETGSLAGGVRVVGEIANRLSRREWPVTIWSVNKRETLTDWFKLDPQVKWVDFFKTGTIADYQPLGVLLQKQRGWKMATYWRTAYIVDQAAQQDEGVYLIQDVETSYTSQPVWAKQVMQTYEMGLLQVTTSRWVEAQLPGTLHIGIGLGNDWRPPKKDKRHGGVFLACARMQALKGWDLLCECIRYITQSGGKIITYGLDKKLPMIVPVSQHFSRPPDDAVLKLYQSCQAFLSTSQHEGFNLTALEAMACGTPVVTTDSHGNHEYLQPEENCLVADDALGLVKALERLNHDRDLRQKFAKTGPDTAARYRWPEVITRLEKVLTES